MEKIKYIKDKLKEEFDLIISEDLIIAVLGYNLDYEMDQFNYMRLDFEWEDD